MTDVERLKATIDCREWIERELGAPHSRSAKYHIYRCPLHNERNGYSLTIWADGWRCWGACNTSGDILKWIQLRQDVTFAAAVNILAAGVGQSPPAERPRHEDRPAASPPVGDWQQAAQTIMAEAESYLWSAPGVRARNYLAARGLREPIIRQARLGYIPGPPQGFTWLHGLRVPHGILIPWVADSQVWMLKVRIASGQPKYRQVKGGAAGGLYWVDHILPGLPIMIVEGEFDCLVVAQASALLCPVALGSASNTLHPQWLDRMVTSLKIFARLDADGAGQKGLSRLQALSARVRPVQVPDGFKDINDLYVLDRSAFLQWLRDL